MMIMVMMMMMMMGDGGDDDGDGDDDGEDGDDDGNSMCCMWSCSNCTLWRRIWCRRVICWGSEQNTPESWDLNIPGLSQLHLHVLR